MIMRHNFMRLLISGLFIFCLSTIWAEGNVVQIAGTTYGGTTKVANNALVLNGAGLRTKFFVKVYTLGLYVPKKNDSADSLIGMSGPKLVEIHMLRDVDAKTFTEALKEGLEDNNSKATLAALKPQVDQLEQLMVQASQVKKGDVVKLEFDPASGTQLMINEHKLGTTIGGGSDFYSALLKIWLGKHAVDGDLKISLLG